MVREFFIFPCLSRANYSNLIRAFGDDHSKNDTILRWANSSISLFIIPV